MLKSAAEFEHFDVVFFEFVSDFDIRISHFPGISILEIFTSVVSPVLVYEIPLVGGSATAVAGRTIGRSIAHLTVAGAMPAESRFA